MAAAQEKLLSIPSLETKMSENKTVVDIEIEIEVLESKASPSLIWPF